MSDIMKPIANLPLTAPPMGITVKEIKGCEFNPELWLVPPHLYLMLFDQRTICENPFPGFYSVPDKGDKVVFCKGFKPYRRSEKNEFGWSTFVFIALEGDPPLDWVPDQKYNYRDAKIHQIMNKDKPSAN